MQRHLLSLPLDLFLNKFHQKYKNVVVKAPIPIRNLISLYIVLLLLEINYHDLMYPVY